MSNFLNLGYSNLNDLVSIHANDITTESLTTKQLTANGDIILTGEIKNGNNVISFNNSTQFTDFAENVHIYKSLFLDYQGVTINVGQELATGGGGGGGGNQYPSITYDSSTNTTTFIGNLLFSANQIASSAINNNSRFVELTTSQVLSNKEFSGTTIFSSIQLNSNLIVNLGSTTILNSNLALINFLSGTTSNINTRFTTNETNITGVQSKTTNITFSGNTTSFSGLINMPTGSLPVNYINGTAVNLIGQQTISGLKTFSNLITFTNNIRLDGSLNVGTAGNVVLANSTLQKIAFISDVTGSIGANLTSLQNQITSINTDYVTESELSTSLSPLQNKTQYMTASSFNTNISNNTNVDDLYISSTINGFSKSDLNNVLTQCASLTSNCANLITQAQNTANSGVSKADSAQSTANTAKSNAQAAQDTANSSLALAITANTAAVGAGTLAGIAQTTASGAASGLATLNTTVEGIELDIDALQLKTTQISYSIATSRTTISQTLYSPYLEISNLTSGFTQTENSPITLAGILTCNNAVNINGTLYLENNNSMIIEGIINQNTADAGTNQFLAPITMSGVATLSGSSTTISSASVQIGVNSTNNFNCNSTASFGGDISMLSSKNLRLRNIVPLLGDDVYFGEGQFNIADDVVFNMKMIANQPVNINNTCQIGTTLNRNTLTAYNTTTLLDGNTSITLNSPIINVTAPYVAIGQTLGFNYLYGTTFVQNLYSSSGIVGMAGQVFQQF